MPKINVLDKTTAELIAAGEVIERPASVIKELVENSIDAGASVITVEIQSGGVRYMRVTDNGCGIAPEDLPTAFLRHATSKVLTAEDLERIGTLGFRGEALASVGAVARVEILTREPAAELGASYRFDGGEAGAVLEAGCPAGTTVLVRDLFYNVPARMKFMKKDSAESAAVASLMDRLALSHPEVSFKLIREGEQKLFTPGDGRLLSAIFAVYGPEFAESLLPVDYAADGMRLTGYISKPECCKPTRGMQHYFINDRYVRSQTMLAALEEAYRNGIMVGKFPGCVLRLTAPLGSVDVNVHPAKLEVKLSDERRVFDLVCAGCRTALATLGNKTRAADTQRGRLNYFEITQKPTQGMQQRITAQQYRAQYSGTAAEPRRSVETLRSDAVGTLYAAALHQQPKRQPHPAAEKQSAAPEALYATRQPEPPQKTEPAVPAEPAALTVRGTPEPPAEARLIGEVFATFILAEQGDDLLLIDKHAAHERILFNRLKTEHADGEVQRQLLLSPLRVTLSREEHQAALDNAATLAKAGFLAEDFGGCDVLLREIPASLGLASGEEAFCSAAERLAQGLQSGTEAMFDELFHSIACKAAIKANSLTDSYEQQKLIELLQNDPSIRNCPHGRPVTVVITRRELEKMFGRIQG